MTRAPDGGRQGGLPGARGPVERNEDRTGCSPRQVLNPSAQHVCGARSGAVSGSVVHGPGR
ncbi:MAG: hypothetical protein ACLQU9_03110 [Acidimicrobiales bacterium]